MKQRWLAVACAGLVLLAASDPVSAKLRHKGGPRCVDRPAEFSLSGIFTNPAPRPNGCAPPVYEYGRYVGQDPDPYIRLQLRRDPATGYATEFAR
ncbi:MAG: hypothetical protein IRY89_06900 [Pseudolabrys sp.]|nr:hypothetical protein [Pseudolabrys sp.]